MNWKIAERTTHTICERLLVNAPTMADTAKDAWQRYHRLRRALPKVRGYTWEDQRAIMSNALQALIPKQHRNAAQTLDAWTWRKGGDVLTRLPHLRDYARNLWRQDLPATIYGGRLQAIRPNLP